MSEVTKQTDGSANFDLETEHHPMSLAMFQALSNVRGFNELNGATYEEYVTKWKIRRGAS